MMGGNPELLTWLEEILPPELEKNPRAMEITFIRQGIATTHYFQMDPADLMFVARSILGEVQDELNSWAADPDEEEEES